MDLPKDLQVVTSDWSQFPLSVEQITYAAYDAWAGVAIAHRLATLHPETFGAAVLQDSLEHQLSIHELYSRRLVRKRARSIMTAILEPHRQSLSKSRKAVAHYSPPTAAVVEPLPLWKSRLVKELNIILNANRHEVHHAGIGRAAFLRNVRNQTMVF
jgi:ribonuclease D